MKSEFQPNIDKLTLILKNHKSYSKVDKTFMVDMNYRNFKKEINFLFPYLIILHGSTISNLKFSKKVKSDIDLVIISLKVGFFPAVRIYNELNSRIDKGKYKLDLDISLETPLGILAHLINETSLGLSLIQGFTIMEDFS